MGENFLEAAKQGRQAALDADARLREIKTIVDDLDAQIRLLSGGEVGVVERIWPPVITMYVPPGNVRQASTTRHYQALVFERQGRAPTMLCEFEPDPAGYPVKVRYDGGFQLASDSAELVGALKEVLATPQAGRSLNALLDPEPVKQTG